MKKRLESDSTREAVGSSSWASILHPKVTPKWSQKHPKIDPRTVSAEVPTAMRIKKRLIGGPGGFDTD